MNITLKNNPDEFNQFLSKKIDLKLFKYKFLLDYIDKVLRRQALLYHFSVINTIDNGWIIILHGDSMLLIYGESWNEAQIQEINEVVDLNKLSEFFITGDNEIIDKLIEFNKPKNFDIKKRRLFYQASQINSFNSDDLIIHLGSLNQSDELALMLQAYYHEEYHGQNDKTIEEMRQRILLHIQAETIYVLSDVNGNVLSFCTIIDPDIGILFTKQEYRNNGYGKIILSYCSKLLLEKNGTVYLMTDRDSIESNIVSEAVGFISYYEYIGLIINI